MTAPRAATPKPLAEAGAAALGAVDWLLADIDDTITTHGRLTAAAYGAMERLDAAGVKVVPVTGRPAGWCDLIARLWPVAAVVGENGALWYAHDPAARRMRRHYVQPPEVLAASQARLKALAAEAMRAAPGAALAADQPFRIFDVAVDFREDVGPLDDAAPEAIARVFRDGGAEAKVSSIHVNAWIGEWDKRAGVQHLFATLWQPLDQVLPRVAFIGDSPNDAPMFARVPLSVGVANIRPFLSAIAAPPAFVTRGEGGAGFVEFAEAVLQARRQKEEPRR
ncbi:HAD-IIB family hydrolase [Falsiroseomonas sp. CW058]|uniref:HAD-IIB family hydrolase n=1 Tax=Falsiroseomonas sp. CW058 TaxID=3388664 RepID=UPI003D3191D1